MPDSAPERLALTELLVAPIGHSLRPASRRSPRLWLALGASWERSGQRQVLEELRHEPGRPWSPLPWRPFRRQPQRLRPMLPLPPLGGNALGPLPQPLPQSSWNGSSPRYPQPPENNPGLPWL